MSVAARRALQAAEARKKERRAKKKQVDDERMMEFESRRAGPVFTRVGDLEPVRLALVTSFIHRRLSPEVTDIEKFLDRRLHLLCGLTLRDAIKVDWSLVKGWMLDVRLKPEDRELQTRGFNEEGEIT